MNSGGWIEQLEIDIKPRTDDGTEAPGKAIESIATTASEELCLKSGRDYQVTNKIKPLMLETGFVDVEELILKVPLGPWADDAKLKDIGRSFERYYKTGLQGWILQIYTKYMGVSTTYSCLPGSLLNRLEL
jgi:hypothetical protein